MASSDQPPGRAAQPKWPLRRVLFVLVGLLSSAAFMTLAVGRLSFGEVKDALGQARIFPWLPLGIACYLVGHVVRGVRCRLLVSHESTISLTTATNVVVLGYGVNNIAPARLGELARAGMLSERTGLPFVQGLSVTIVERIMDGLVMLALLAATQWLLVAEAWVASLLNVAAVLFGVALVMLVLAVSASAFVLALTSRIAGVFGERLHDRAVHFVDQVLRSVIVMRQPRQALRLGRLSLTIWLLESGMFLALLPAFGLPADPLVAILIMTITNLGILAPSSPGFIGTFHLFCMRVLVALGITEAVSFSYAVLVHLAFYIPITAWGVGVLSSYGYSLGDAYRRKREATALDLPGQAELDLKPALGPEATATPTIRAVVEALLPLDEAGAELSDEQQREITAAVAAFVQGQVQALSARLQLLLALGLLGVRAITRLRFLRGLSSLPPERRRRWINRWAYGRFSLGRQLFRGLRATALVGFYSQPPVRRWLERGAAGSEPQPARRGSA